MRCQHCQHGPSSLSIAVSSCSSLRRPETFWRPAAAAAARHACDGANDEHWLAHTMVRSWEDENGALAGTDADKSALATAQCSPHEAAGALVQRAIATTVAWAPSKVRWRLRSIAPHGSNARHRLERQLVGPATTLGPAEHQDGCNVMLAQLRAFCYAGVRWG